MPDVFRLTRIVSTATGGTQFVAADVPLTSQGIIGRMSDAGDAGTVQFRETDEDYDWDYHAAPARQLILLLDGEIEIACTDRGADGHPVGTLDVRRFGSGDVLLVEDVDGYGHKTRQLSSGPRRSVFVTLADGAFLDPGAAGGSA